MEFEKYVPPEESNALTEKSQYQSKNNAKVDEDPKDKDESFKETFNVPIYQNDVILPEFKPKYSIFINRSSFVDTP